MIFIRKYSQIYMGRQIKHQSKRIMTKGRYNRNIDWFTGVSSFNTNSNFYCAKEEHTKYSAKIDYIAQLRETFDKDECDELIVPIFKRCLLHSDQIAIEDSNGQQYTYLQLYTAAKKLSIQISNVCGSGALRNVAFFSANNIISPMLMWSCWMSGQVAMPLNHLYSLEILQHQVQQARAPLIIATPEHEPLVHNISTQLQLPLIIVDHSFLNTILERQQTLDNLLLTANNSLLIAGMLNNDFYTQANALLLHTAGTMSRPKSVAITHKHLDAQCKCLMNAWQLCATDKLLYVVGRNSRFDYIIALLSFLNAGARVIMHQQFQIHNVWSQMFGINAPLKDRVNVFIAEPRIYRALIAEYDKLFAKDSTVVSYIENFCKKHFRLMLCGCVQLPTDLYRRWQSITGHSILECYGTTESGIVLSNPYAGGDGNQRRPGTVGLPLPGVRMRFVNADKKVLMDCRGNRSKCFWLKNLLSSEQPNRIEATSTTSQTCAAGIVGELQIATEQFLQYSKRKRNAIQKFIKTDDLAVYDEGVFRLIGRLHVEKYKIANEESTMMLEVETILFSQPNFQITAILNNSSKAHIKRIGVICILQQEQQQQQPIDDADDANSLETTIRGNTFKLYCSQALPNPSHATMLNIVNDESINSDYYY